MRIRDVWRPFALPHALAPAFGGAAREADPGFDPLRHVRPHAPTPDFHQEAGRLMGRPLARGIPPWEAHVLPGEDGTRFAVLFKFHHALADHLPPLGHRLGGPLLGQAARLLFDILVTSVPLPGLGLRLGGHSLTEVYPLAPLARGQSLAVAVSAFQGRVHYGLVDDAEAVPDLNVLTRGLTEELACLTALTRAR